MNWFIPVVILVLGGVFVFVLYRRSGGSFAEVLLQLWDSLRDRWANRGAGDAEAAVPPPAPAAPLPPPAPGPAPAPAAANGAAEAVVPDPTAEPAAMAQSDLLYAMSALVQMASNGDIRTVRRVINTFAAAAAGMGGGIARLSVRLAEPDKHYDGSIWEPLGTAGQQIRAASLYCQQADAAAVSLIHLTVGELADSPRQAPHHSQLNGGN